MANGLFSEKHPLEFALTALIVCLGVYSATSYLVESTPLAAAAVAAAVALAFFAASRTTFWPPNASIADRADARKIAIAAIVSGIAVSLLGIFLGAWEPQPTDIPLLPMTIEGPSPLLVSLISLIALCVLTGIYEEALFSAVLFGGLRRYYGEANAAEKNGLSPTLASRLTSRAAAVQGILFAVAHVAGGLIAFAQTFSLVVALQVVVWFAGTFLFGIVTAVLMETGRSLVLNAAVHAVYDFALFSPLALQAGTIRPTTVTGDAIDLALFTVQAVVLAAAFFALYFSGKRTKRAE